MKIAAIFLAVISSPAAVALNAPKTKVQALDDDLKKVIETHDLYLTKSNADNAVLNANKWQVPEATCDSTLFASIRTVTGGTADPGLAENEDQGAKTGEVTRKDSRDCLKEQAIDHDNDPATPNVTKWIDNGSKTSSSRDMYFGFLFWLLEKTKTDIYKRVLQYAIKNKWKIGRIFEYRKVQNKWVAADGLEPFKHPEINITASLQATMCEMIKKLDNTATFLDENQNNFDLLKCSALFDTVNVFNVADFDGHLMAMHALLRLRVTEGVTEALEKSTKTLSAVPMNAMYRALHALALASPLLKREVIRGGGGQQVTEIKYTTLKAKADRVSDNTKEICRLLRETADIVLNKSGGKFAGKTLFPEDRLPADGDRSTYYLWQRAAMKGGNASADWSPGTGTQKYSGTDMNIVAWILDKIPDVDCSAAPPTPTPEPTSTGEPLCGPPIPKDNFCDSQPCVCPAGYVDYYGYCHEPQCVPNINLNDCPVVHEWNGTLYETMSGLTQPGDECTGTENTCGLNLDQPASCRCAEGYLWNCLVGKCVNALCPEPTVPTPTETPTISPSGTPLPEPSTTMTPAATPTTEPSPAPTPDETLTPVPTEPTPTPLAATATPT